MARFIKYTLTILVLLLSSQLLPAQQLLRVGVGNFEPFFIEKGERGLFLDITKEIFKLLPEYEVKFIFMSNTRLLQEMKSDIRIDAACNIFPNSETNAYLSTPIFRYTDVAVSKAENNIVIDQISDLQDKSIAAYQGATDLLGEEFKKMALANPQYAEYALPSETTKLVALNNKEVRVGDIYIFLHDIEAPAYKERKDVDAGDFVIHKLWPDVYSHIAFRDKDIRDKANIAIQEIKTNGTLDRIYKEYETYLKLQ